jgi:hypothetical protein
MNIKINNVNDFIFVISAITSFPFLKELDTARKNRICGKQFLRILFSRPLLIFSLLGFIISLICLCILIYNLLK